MWSANETTSRNVPERDWNYRRINEDELEINAAPKWGTKAKERRTLLPLIIGTERARMALDPYRRKTKARYRQRIDGPSGRSRVSVVLGLVGFIAMLGLLYNLGQISELSSTASRLFAWNVQAPP
jgi:hypothetical protein